MLHNIIAEAYFNTPGIKMMLQNIIFKYKRINDGAALNLEGGERGAVQRGLFGRIIRRIGYRMKPGQECL